MNEKVKITVRTILSCLVASVLAIKCINEVEVLGGVYDVVHDANFIKTPKKNIWECDCT